MNTQTVNWDTFRKTAPNGSKLGIGTKQAREIVANIGPDAAQSLADATREYLPEVMAEIESLRNALSTDYDNTVRKAILFAIGTPMRNLKISIDMSRYYFRHMPSSAADAESTMTYVNPDGKVCGINLRTQFTQAMADCLPILEHPSRAMISRDILKNKRQISIKVATMAMAVIDPDAAVWTVDRHHMRQLLAMAGMQYDYSEVAHGNETAYQIMEAWFLAWHAQYFPEYPVWAVQWAAWDVAHGSHQIHRFIWE